MLRLARRSLGLSSLATTRGNGATGTTGTGTTAGNTIAKKLLLLCMGGRGLVMAMAAADDMERADVMLVLLLERLLRPLPLPPAPPPLRLPLLGW